MKRPQIVNLELEDIAPNEDVSNNEKYINQIELERDQLAAQNFMLNEKLASVRDDLYGRGYEVAGYHLNGDLEPLDGWFEHNDWDTEESPAASLAEIRAKAIESAVERVRYEFEGPMHLDSIEDFFDAICEEVRQQAKQGDEQ